MVKKDSNRAATQLVQAIGISAMTDTNDTIRNARSDAYKELAALAAAPNGYDKHERETLLRERVMDSVIRIRESLDRMTPALSARASAGEGGEWSLAPHEPTKSMVSEAVYNTNRKYDKVVVDATIVRQVWSAMMWARPVTAAPQPAQAGASGGGRWLAEQDAKHLGTGYLVDGERVAPDRIEIIAAAPQPQEAPDDFVKVENAVRSLPSGYAFADAVEHATPSAHGDGEDLHHAVWSIVRPYIQPAAREKVNAALKESLTTRPTPEAQEARDERR